MMEIRGVRDNSRSSLKDYKGCLQVREAVDERKAKGERRNPYSWNWKTVNFVDPFIGVVSALLIPLASLPSLF